MKYLVTLLLILSLNIYAEGEREGGGGHPTCDKSFELGVQIAHDLVKIGNETVQEKSPLVDVNLLYRLAIKRKVLPGDPAGDRVAESFVDNQETILDVEKYESISSIYRLYRLEMHELLVLAGIEIDGVYVVTNELIEVFPKFKPDYAKLKKYTTSYSCNETTKMCTLHRPLIEVVRNEPGEGTVRRVHYFSVKSNPLGICGHYNLVGGEVVDTDGDLPRKWYKTNLGYQRVMVDENSNMVKFVTEAYETSAYYVENIKCRMMD